MSKTFQFNGTSYVSSLPFINESTGNWFDITPTGDTETDLEIGTNCALMLLKAMADDFIATGLPPITKQQIITKIIFSLLKQDSATMKNIIVSFFWVFDVVIQSGSTKLTPELVKLSYDDLILENHPVIH